MFRVNNQHTRDNKGGPRCERSAPRRSVTHERPGALRARAPFVIGLRASARSARGLLRRRRRVRTANGDECQVAASSVTETRPAIKRSVLVPRKGLAGEKDVTITKEMMYDARCQLAWLLVGGQVVPSHCVFGPLLYAHAGRDEPKKTQLIPLRTGRAVKQPE